MQYDVTISQNNIRAHLDIERDIQALKNGHFSFTIRVSQGNIEDYVTYRTVSAASYRSMVVAIQKRGLAHDIGTGDYQSTIRPDKR
jgi:hypothetical protein